MARPQERVEEPRKKKDRYAKVVAKSVSTPSVEGKSVETSSTLAEVSQLNGALGQCMQQLQQPQRSVVQGRLSVQSSPSVVNANLSDVSGMSPPTYSSVGPQVVPAPIAMPTPHRFVSTGDLATTVGRQVILFGSVRCDKFLPRFPRFRPLKRLTLIKFSRFQALGS